MADDVPTWELFHRLNEGSNLPPAGRAAVQTVLERLERRLGRSWPRRQFERQGWLPPELTGFSAYTAVLPQLLMLLMRLEEGVEQPSFARVLSGIRNTCTTTDWRHALLQLEVARAARAAGWSAAFEPDIPNSVNQGDLLVDTGDGEPILVETTTLGRTNDDLVTEQFEDGLQDWLRWLEVQHGVHTITEVSGWLEPEAAQSWCDAILRAAAAVAMSGTPTTVESPAGTVSVRPGDAPVGVATFSGVPRERDLGRRLRKLVLDKAKQSAGPYPTWIRADGLDGMFAFTGWAQGTPEERIAALSELLVGPLADHTHVHGVIYSSGLAAGGYGAQLGSLDATDTTRDGIFLRRELAQFLLREAVVLPVRPEGWEMATAWGTAYGSEADWLDADLTARGLPRLAQIRS